MIQNEQTKLIGWMEDCQRVLYIQERRISSRRESQSREKHGMNRHVFRSNKVVFESEPEEEHDDQQVAFQVQSQQRCYSVS